MTVQIYSIVSDLILGSRKVSFPEYAGQSKSSYQTVFLGNWQELTGNQRAYVATMVAMGQRSFADYHSLVFRMEKRWFMSHATCTKTRNELISLNVISKLPGSRYRYVLNPDYHPNMSDEVSEVISRKLADYWYAEAKSKAD